MQLNSILVFGSRKARYDHFYLSALKNTFLQCIRFSKYSDVYYKEVLMD